jgi:hypothetical protein
MIGAWAAEIMGGCGLTEQIGGFVWVLYNSRVSRNGMRRQHDGCGSERLNEVYAESLRNAV